jgi:hypothetical protein
VRSGRRYWPSKSNSGPADYRIRELDPPIKTGKRAFRLLSIKRRHPPSWKASAPFSEPLTRQPYDFAPGTSTSELPWPLFIRQPGFLQTTLTPCTDHIGKRFSVLVNPRFELVFEPPKTPPDCVHRCHRLFLLIGRGSADNLNSLVPTISPSAVMKLRRRTRSSVAGNSRASRRSSRRARVLLVIA